MKSKRKVKYNAKRRERELVEIAKAMINRYPHIEMIAKKGDRYRIAIEAYLDTWRDKLYDLDDVCLGLYSRGLDNYNEKNFSEIYEKEKRWIKSTRTLAIHLDHLRAFELIRRKPEDGGRGHPGRYYFNMPHIPNENFFRNKEATRFIGNIDALSEVLALEKLVNEEVNEPEQLACQFKRLFHANGIMLADLLERAELISNKNKACKFFFEESHKIDLKIDVIALVLLHRHSKVAREGAKQFHNYVSSLIA